MGTTGYSGPLIDVGGPTMIGTIKEMLVRGKQIFVRAVRPISDYRASRKEMDAFIQTTIDQTKPKWLLLSPKNRRIAAKRLRNILEGKDDAFKNESQMLLKRYAQEAFDEENAKRDSAAALPSTKAKLCIPA